MMGWIARAQRTEVRYGIHRRMWKTNTRYRYKRRQPRRKAGVAGAFAGSAALCPSPPLAGVLAPLSPCLFPTPSREAALLLLRRAQENARRNLLMPQIRFSASLLPLLRVEQVDWFPRVYRGPHVQSWFSVWTSLGLSAVNKAQALRDEIAAIESLRNGGGDDADRSDLPTS